MFGQLTSPPLPSLTRMVGYHRMRDFVAWFGRTFAIQCSGRRRNGFAYEQCQYKVGHKGACRAWTGEEFSADLCRAAEKQSPAAAFRQSMLAILQRYETELGTPEYTRRYGAITIDLLAIPVARDAEKA